MLGFGYKSGPEVKVARLKPEARVNHQDPELETICIVLVLCVCQMMAFD